MNDKTESSDEECCLSSETFNALNEFYKEQEEKERLEKENDSSSFNFEEDWQLSQFWYHKSTKEDMARVCLKLIEQDPRDSADIKIGLISCPSLYTHIKDVHPNVALFEFDRRFEVYGDDFVYYDYREVSYKPNFLEAYKNAFDILIIDPPFLSEECITRTSMAVKKLRRTDESKIIFNTSGDMIDHLKVNLNLNLCQWRPEHTNNLGNLFNSFANFNLDELIIKSL